MRFISPVHLVLFALTLSSGRISADDALELEVGFDGSNPGSYERVVKDGPDRWLIRPFNEEGSNDAYWFRFNIRIVNHSERAKDAELLVEWPVLEREPDYPYEYYFYGDMGDWHPAYAFIDGKIARLTVPCRPGVTYVGFYPRYSYGRYQEFIGQLSGREEIRVNPEGKSFQQREIHSLRMGTRGRPRLLITARNHPYETGGSYIVEEMVRWLCSGEPEARRLLTEYEIFFLPMMNPDGVATGCNQRTRPVGGVNMSFGADSDDPSVKALLGMVARIQPALWADIHSWPHEGDDGMWCTERWVADRLLEDMPDSTFDGYVWKVSFVEEGATAENHLWRWLMRTQRSGGVSLSFSWYRRNEEHLRRIARRLIVVLCETAGEAPGR